MKASDHTKIYQQKMANVLCNKSKHQKAYVYIN